MEFFVILTAARPADGGFRQVTISRIATVAENATREEIFGWAASQLPSGWEPENTNILFFSAEPNSLAA
jgi:hypothetical protein